MKDNKNTFECVFRGDHIWFPNYVHFSPQSFGMVRRNWIFQEAFPDKSSSICSEKSWDFFKEDRVLFTYDEELKILTKVEDK
jgi:hypothetical protein